MSEILETMMIISFGASWPVNGIKAWKARTAKSTSPLFLCLILFGYCVGIASKLLNQDYMANFATKWYVLICYILNFIVVSINLGIYFRNKKLDSQK